MNRLIDPNQTGENVYVRYSSTGIPIACVYGPRKRVIVPPKQARRAVRLMKKHKLLGDPPPLFPKPRVVDLRAWAAKRKPVTHEPASIVRTVKARVIYTDADGSTVELEPTSISMSFAADSSAIGGKAEVEGSLSNCPAANSSATMIGGSILKHPRVDLGEASQVLVENLNPGQDSSAATIGTIEEVKEGDGKLKLRVKIHKLALL